MNAPAPGTAHSGLTRWAALGGVVYVVLFVVGGILAFGGQPDLDAPPGEVIEYFSDSGHRDKIGIGWLIIVIGVFFFLWFLAALRQALRRIDGDGLLTNVTTIGGAVYAACTLAGVSFGAAVKTMSDDTYQDQVFPELIHAADDASYVMHASGGVGVAALMIAASLAALRAGVVPKWLGWLGIVSGILAVFSITFFPQFLIAIWLVVAALAIFRSAGPAPAAPAAPAAAPPTA
jgi:hypothetical protein